MEIRPFVELIRLEKPAGWLLFLWPFAWGLTMAAYKQHIPLEDYFTHMCKCVFGSFMMRSSACTINDIFDRKLDASVERTKSRPLPSGRVSVYAASLYVLLQFTIGIAFFSLYNKVAFWTVAVQMIPLLCLYPLMKRITYWPQAWLGVAINFGFPVSWLSVGAPYSSAISINTVICMVLSLWCWTMVYDTVYGCQDRKDDIKAGIWSTAVLFGDKALLAVKCFATGFIGLLYISGRMNGQSVPFFVVSVGGGALFIVWQLMVLDVQSSLSCWAYFKNNAYYLRLIVYAGLFLDYLLSVN